jgi:hypothetical protein
VETVGLSHSRLPEGATPKEGWLGQRTTTRSRRRPLDAERASAERTDSPSFRARRVHLRVPFAGRANRGSSSRGACVEAELDASKGPPPDEVKDWVEARALKRGE